MVARRLRRLLRSLHEPFGPFGRNVEDRTVILAERHVSTFGLRDVNRKRLVGFCLHEYESHEQYRQVQTCHNKGRIDRVWADEATLTILCHELRREIRHKARLRGICHGTRNGCESASSLRTRDTT